MEVNRSVLRLIVSNFQATFNFYRNVIGLPLDVGTEDDAFAEFDAGTVLLTLIDRSYLADFGFSVPNLQDPRGGDQATLVLQVRDFDAVLKELASKGVGEIGGPYPLEEWNMRVAHLRDPDGNLMSVVTFG